MAFGGQGGAWLENLEELVSSAGIESELSEIVGEAALLLEPVARELVVVRPIGFEPLQWVRALAADEPLPTTKQLITAAISGPGILLAQMAAIRALTRQGLDLHGTPPVAMAGHSQGIIACESLRAKGAKDAELLALLQLIGAAGSLVSRRRGMVGRGDKSPMVSVTNVDPDRIAELLEDFSPDVRTVLPPVLSIRNGRRSVVITGTPEQLARFELYCSKITEKEEAERKNKMRGGAVFSPEFHGVQVEVGFHTPRLADGVEVVDRWAAKCGIDAELAHEMTESIFVAPDRLGRRGRAAARRRREVDRRPRPERHRHPPDRPGDPWPRRRHRPGRHPRGAAQPVHRRRRARGAAGMVELRAVGGEAARRLGQAVDQVHPAHRTLADPAGGHDPDDRRRQDRRRGRQRRPLGRAGRRRPGHRGDLRRPHRRTHRAAGARPRRTVQLAVPRPVPVEAAGGRKAVGAEGPSVRRADRRRRRVSAGIPDLEEAVDLIDELNSVGISHVVFKPGTVDQIKSVIKIAAEVPGKDVIVHIEGGRAGGHHSWEDLDDLLLATYAELRKLPNITVCVGGGIGTPERAAEYLSGRWAEDYGFPAMPVDGILVGTAAMATLESTTSPAVKQMLVETTGTDHWISAGKAQGGMASSRSQLGADIHEIDNAASRCGRLLDEVAGDAEAVAARRDELIAAMANTAKPYFGDVGDMTYLQWLQRYVELTIGDGDSTADTASPDSPWLADTWRDRFEEMLKRAEARLHPQDSGPIDTLFDDSAKGTALLENPEAAIAALLARYPDAETVKLHPADVPFFITLCKTLGKPVNFVPVIDKDVRRWWRSDSLWQAHDARYTADQVCIIPGTQSVAGITRVDEPVGELLDRFEQASIDEVLASGAQPVAGGLAPPGPRRRHRSARRRARLARRVVGGPHRDQPGAPHR